MKPFEGIRILDLTHVLAGPFSTYQLAVLGADVIKIESPDNPDMTRQEGVLPEENQNQYGTYFQGQNAGKRAITLNLKTSQGKAILWRLIKTADVLVQNYAASSLDRLGFSYQEVEKKNPSIIYCSISGYGKTGPKANHPAYDVVIQAFSGLMAANGEENAPPVRVGPPLVDYGTGAQAALAISAALFQRHQTKRGQYIDVSMLDSALMLMTAHVKDTLATGVAPRAHGNAHPLYAGYATYPTQEGVIMVGAWTNRQLAALLRTLGNEKRAEEVANTARSEIHFERDSDREFIADQLLTKSAAEWEDLLNEAHVPAAKVRTIDEAIATEQVLSRKVIQQPSNHPGNSTPSSACTVAGFSYLHGSPSVERPPPQVGEHTDEVLSEIGYSIEEINNLRHAKVV
ncbi:MAG: CoA transferase [Gammaproteobacteria bacterium]|nr:CoA transferase [Gammaproteobacteria bacterium]